MVNGLHLYSAFIQSAVQFMPLIHPFTHTFTHQRRLAAMQGTNQLVRSNRGLGVLLRDTSTRPRRDQTGNPPTARRLPLPPEPHRPKQLWEIAVRTYDMHTPTRSAIVFLGSVWNKKMKTLKNMKHMSISRYILWFSTPDTCFFDSISHQTVPNQQAHSTQELPTRNSLSAQLFSATDIHYVHTAFILYQYYYRDGLPQLYYYRDAPGLPQLYTSTTTEMHQVYLSSIPALLQRCTRSTSALYQHYYRDAPGLPQLYTSTTTEMHQVYLSSTPALLQRCTRSTSALYQHYYRDAPGLPQLYTSTISVKECFTRRHLK